MTESRDKGKLEDQALLKKLAAQHATGLVESGMVLGLGTGSTVRFVLEGIGDLIRSGELKDIVGIPSSLQTERQAGDYGIPMTTFETHRELDMTIDGADEVDPALNLIKGGGGALLREKILAQASRRNVIIVDESKLVPRLGHTWAVPVEVLPFAWPAEARYLETLGATVKLRKNDDQSPFISDQRNYILDSHFGSIPDAKKLAAQMCRRAGIMEHGLFLGLATEVIVAGKDGVRVLKR